MNEQLNNPENKLKETPEQKEESDKLKQVAEKMEGGAKRGKVPLAEIQQQLRQEDIAAKKEKDRLMKTLSRAYKQKPEMGNVEMDTEGQSTENLRRMANNTTAWGRLKNWWGDNIYRGK